MSSSRELFAAMEQLFNNLQFDPPGPDSYLMWTWETEWPPDRLGVDGDEEDEA